MKGPLICKALIARPFFIRTPTLARAWQGGFVGDSEARAGRERAGSLEAAPRSFARSAQRKAGTGVPKPGCGPARQPAHRSWVWAASFRPGSPTGLCPGYRGETSGIDDPTVSVHLGSGRKFFRFLPVPTQSMGQGGWAGWSPSRPRRLPSPGRNRELRVCRRLSQASSPSQVILAFATTLGLRGTTCPTLNTGTGPGRGSGARDTWAQSVRKPSLLSRPLSARSLCA